MQEGIAENFSDGKNEVKLVTEEISVTIDAWLESCPLSSFKKQINSFFGQIPKMYVGRTYIETSISGGFEDITDATITITAFWERPETKEEANIRIGNEKAAKLLKEAEARKLYEKLKSRFEP